MKRLTALIAAVAAVFGVTASVWAYRLAANTGQTDQITVAQPRSPEAAPATEKPKPVVKFKKCKAPAHREGKFCVTDVVQNVILPAPASTGSGSSRGSGANSDDDRDDERSTKGDDRDDDRDSDHDDDDHGDDDDDHGDDDHGDDD